MTLDEALDHPNMKCITPLRALAFFPSSSPSVVNGLTFEVGQSLFVYTHSRAHSISTVHRARVTRKVKSLNAAILHANARQHNGRTDVRKCSNMGQTRIQMSIKKHLRITHIDAALMGAVNHQKYYTHLLLIACVYKPPVNIL